MRKLLLCLIVLCLPLCATNYYQIDGVIYGIASTDGLLNADGTVTVYNAGTTDLRDCFTSKSGGAASNPFTLDSIGRGSLYTASGWIKIVIKDSDAVTIFTQDNIWVGISVVSSDTLELKAVKAMDASGLSLIDDGDNLGVFIEDGGQVGIGTNAPSQPLEVSGSGVSQRIKITSTDGNLASLWLENTEGGTQFINDENAFGIYDQDQSAYRLRILDNGQVGIGTNSPSQPLEVSGSGVSQRIKITATDGNLASLWLENTEGGTQFINDEDAFGIYDQDEAAYRLRILDTGQVGIGTTQPVQLLSVNSDSVQIVQTQSPASADPGDTGEVAWDSTFVYVYTGVANGWGRATLEVGY